MSGTADQHEISPAPLWGQTVDGVTGTVEPKPPGRKPLRSA
ncbi:MAG: hypothetical protein V5A27_01665 [Halapricum sp.]